MCTTRRALRRSSRPGWAAALVVALVGVLAIPAQAAGGAADETLLLTLTNTARAAAGVAPLTLDPTLSSIARQWASAMAANGTISHNGALKDQLAANGIDWSKEGENVGMGPSVASINQALLASSGHYRNIVDPELQRVGIGVVFAANTVWVVEDFVTPAGASASAAPSAPPAPVTVPATVPPTTAPPVTVPPTTTTTTLPPTTLPPTTVPTTLPPAVAPGAVGGGLPLYLTVMLQQARALGGRP